MLNDLKVKVGPQFYEYHMGAINQVPTVLKEYQVKKILIVHGTTSWEKGRSFLPFSELSCLDVTYHKYTGECSYYGANLIKEIVRKEHIDFIIGIGGGKLVDLVGYSAHISNVNFGVIPTLASNCAPWTPLSVMYKESGESEGKTEHYIRQAAFFITDPRLVIDSPVEYFIAGLADTLAKWYEADLILQQPHLSNIPFLKMAEYTSVLCKQEILKNATQAIMDMEAGKLSNEFTRLSEIIFAIAGMVGGLGDKYARNTVAHAMHDGISKYIPESHRYLHGEKVAYGICYQLALEENWSEIKCLLPFYKELGLPYSLKQMGLFPENLKIIEKIVTFIDSKEKVHLLPIDITRDRLRKTIYSLEEYMERSNQ